MSIPMRKFLTAVPNDFWLYVHDSMRDAAPLRRYFVTFNAITRLTDTRWQHLLTNAAIAAILSECVATARAWHCDVPVVN